MTDYIGHQVDRYEIVEQIAKGGMATVYRAWQASMNRHVAIKMLPPQFTHDDTFLERFYREAEVVAGLQHPHILPVYDFGEYDNCPYLVMAYLSGGTLTDLIAEGPMDPKEVGRLVAQIADALDYAHSKGIIHRDLKPGNVLLDERGNAYLADFGLARIAESASEITGTSILGTPTYMAPEQASSTELTPAADIYALGVTIFQMLSGRVPYEAPSAVGLIMAHATMPIPNILEKRPDLPGETQTIISRSMAKKAAERYATPSALASSLAFALETATHELAVAEGDSRDALMMTNMLGHVIFVDNPCLKLLKRHHSEARAIIGKSLAEVLGLSRSVAEQIIEDIKRDGSVQDLELEVSDANGTSFKVRCSAIATRDEQGAFVGADLSLRAFVVSDAQGEDAFDTATEILDSKEATLLQTYFVAHLESLRDLVVQLGGKKLGGYLDSIINETAQRNLWPVKVHNGQVTVELTTTEVDIYRALLAKAITYAVSLIGKNMVIRSIQRVDGELDSSVLELVDDLMLEEVISDIIQ